MASEQARRENVVKEREVKVEKDKVPKMTSHFESMADKSRGSDTQSHHHEEGEEETKMKRTQMPHSVGKFVVISGDKEGTGKKEGQERTSLEDIHEYRANAQQKSMDTIRAAEERNNKAKESLSHGGQGGEAADVFGQEGLGRVGVELKGEGREELESGAHGFHGEKARHAQLLAAGGEEIKERKGQVSVRGGGRSATDTVTEKGLQAKESVGKGTASEKGQRASEKFLKISTRRQGKLDTWRLKKGKRQRNKLREPKIQRPRKLGELLSMPRRKEEKQETAEQAAKDIAAEKAQRASQCLTEKGKETGNLAAQKGQRPKNKRKEAAEYAQETMVEGGKEAAHYAGVAAEKAAAVGLMQGTKSVAGTVKERWVMQGIRRQKESCSAADNVVGYRARKKKEAQHKDQEIHQINHNYIIIMYLVAQETVFSICFEGGEEEKQTGFVTEPRRGFGEEYGEGRASGENFFDYGAKGTFGEARRDIGEELYGGGRRNERYVPEEGVGEGGVLGAIGETIAEIAKATMNLVIGDPPGRTHDHGATDYMRHEHGHR
ncbi:hypothetical protein Bca4012_018169 [Brassica carinata]|uniref:Seed maturation protein n=1 Tax=Brassica carinata TaxID=52824 RepID=A0A8X7WM64_BRACI|nr:hypothetical protein Bca52824_003456 [Brassica carinata]